MKKRMTVSLLAAGCSLLLATTGMAQQQSEEQSQQDQQQQQQQQQQESEYAKKLVTPDKISEMKVQNQQGEEIGTIDKVVLDSEEGQIAYVVVTSGGFWGVGGDKAVIPWKAVKMQQQGQQEGQQQGEPVLVLDANKEMLMNAPQGEIQETLDQQQAEQIHQYYGVSPYWEEQGQQQQQEEQQMEQEMEQEVEQEMQQERSSE